MIQQEIWINSLRFLGDGGLVGWLLGWVVEGGGGMGPTVADGFPSQMDSNAKNVPFNDVTMLELTIYMLNRLQERKKNDLSNQIT